MRYFFIAYILLIVLVVSMAGFRGDRSPLPPIMLLNDMDNQPKLLPQSESHFFADGASGRPRIPGTIPVGYEMPTTALSAGGGADIDGYTHADDYLNTGRMGEYYGHGMPEEIEVDLALLELGRKKYEIYCQICHGASGNGGGVISKYGLVPANLVISPVTDPEQRPDGNLYDVITNGKGLMGAYGSNLTLRDRWAVVAYVRALQQRTSMPAEDVQEAFDQWEASQKPVMRAAEGDQSEPGSAS